MEIDFTKKLGFLKIGIVILSLCFAIPSIIYIIYNKTILNFNYDFKFLLTDAIPRINQAGIFFVIAFAFLLFYYYILKNNKKLFTNIRQVFMLIIIVSAIFVFVLPFFSSDIFYYLGIGRLNSTYHQNPYYVDMRSYIDNENVDIQNDTVMQKGYNNYWANTTVVYGALWTMICSGISFLSFGNLEIGLLLFKLLNLLVHIGNCYLLYKISRKKIFPLIYGLNPFILIEGIANVHNDIFVIFFILLSIYMLLRRKNIVLSILFLALAFDIKYISILLLPLIVIYNYRDKNIKERLIKCIEFGALFAIFAILPYLIYIRDIQVFNGIFAQQDKIAKGMYLFVAEYFHEPSNLVIILKNVLLWAFAAIYVVKCILLLHSKNIKFYKEMRIMFLFMLAFVFLLITSFQPWYLIWLVPFMIWNKTENIKLIVQIQVISLLANTVFLIYSENYRYGVPYFVILIFGILLSIIYNKNDKFNRIVGVRNK